VEPRTRVLTGQCGVPGEGPFAVATLQVYGERIESLTIRTNGCIAARIAAAGAERLLAGRSLAGAANLTGSDLLVVLRGQLPEGKEETANRVVNAVLDAISKDGG
jgi:hypothetical protein